MRAKLGGLLTQYKYDLFIRSNRTAFLAKEKMTSGYAGLFWFSDDYKIIEDVRDMKEFTYGDVLFKRELGPGGSHSDYRELDLRRPKGRVTLMPDGVVINVGLKCPDRAISLVKRQFELGILEEVVRVNPGSHWDSKK